MIVPSVNLELYKSFYWVHHYVNVTHAAEHMNRDRTGVSKDISELERELGLKLFTRTSKGVKRTAAGENLYQTLAPIFETLKLNETNLREFDEKSAGEIKIACATNFAGHIVAEFIGMFEMQYPLIQFNNSQREIEGALKDLAERKVELIFNTVPFNKEIAFERTVLLDFSETYFSSHEYAQQHNLRPVITKEKFDALSVITLRPQETKRNSKHVVDTQGMLLKYVNKNLGVGCCIEQFLDLNYPKDFVFKFKVEGMELTAKIFECIYDKDYLSKSAKAFLDNIKANLGCLF